MLKKKHNAVVMQGIIVITLSARIETRALARKFALFNILQ